MKDNEILYITGNPDLENSRHGEFRAGYTWLPSNVFNVNAYGHYEGWYDRYTVAYLPYEDGNALLRSYINDGDFHQCSFGVSFNYKILGGDMSFNVNPELNYYKSTGIYVRDVTSGSLRAGVMYNRGNCYFSSDYNMRVKELQNNSNLLVRGRDNYRFIAGWSNGDLNIRFTASNIFSKGWLRSTSDFRSPLYSEIRHSYASTYHPSVSLSVTYTFGYGKKIKRDNEVGAQDGIQSAILN